MKPCWSVPLSSWLQPTLIYISARWCSMLEMAGRIMCQRNCALTGGRERRLLLKVIVSCGELTSSFQESSRNVWSRSYTWHIQEWFIWKLLLTVMSGGLDWIKRSKTIPSHAHHGKLTNLLCQESPCIPGHGQWWPDSCHSMNHTQSCNAINSNNLNARYVRVCHYYIQSLQHAATRFWVVANAVKGQLKMSRLVHCVAAPLWAFYLSKAWKKYTKA